MHVHASCGDGEAKFWLDPEIELARNHRLSGAQLGQAKEIIEAHHDELRSAWTAHFGN